MERIRINMPFEEVIQKQKIHIKKIREEFGEQASALTKTIQDAYALTRESYKGEEGDTGIWHCSEPHWEIQELDSGFFHILDRIIQTKNNKARTALRNLGWERKGDVDRKLEQEVEDGIADYMRDSIILAAFDFGCNEIKGSYYKSLFRMPISAKQLPEAVQNLRTKTITRLYIYQPPLAISFIKDYADMMFHFLGVPVETESISLSFGNDYFFGLGALVRDKEKNENCREWCAFNSVMKQSPHHYGYYREKLNSLSGKLIL